MNKGKPIWESKTIWANVVGLAAMAAPYIHPAGALLADPAMQTQIVGAVLGLVNIALRFATQEPIKFK